MRAFIQGDTANDVLYSYTSSADDADFTLGTDKRIMTRTVSLPGGVLYTMHLGEGATTPTWDIPSISGNIALTCDNTGKQVGDLRTYTPYGEPLTPTGVVDSDAVPDNQSGQMDYGWQGQHQRAYEHADSLSLVQMGARPYSPLLGRFLSVDPVEGGSANDYDYVFAGPINKTDTAGTNAISDWWNGIRDTGWFKDTTNTLFTIVVAKVSIRLCRGFGPAHSRSAADWPPTTSVPATSRQASAGARAIAIETLDRCSLTPSGSQRPGPSAR